MTLTEKLKEERKGERELIAIAIGTTTKPGWNRHLAGRENDNELDNGTARMEPAVEIGN